ncbi:Teichoic acid translocation permease protein TagG (plasmid) [Aquisphaera giovannonii]|uniref:Transport permease protein n=1 Tax=Aquisphaera giovannonii TaxID=406548 RepID=A0A5B9WHA6_9BACT|nr:ABC transporter permease [Aquisphaera giovannonii]QEH39220.1 Teichoic acid translocation permease protein TagG [Aquisphaera giovannonii]
MIEASESIVAPPPVRNGESDGPDPRPRETEPASPHEVVLRARSGWLPIDWAEIYAYRELFFFLIWRDVSARYKQTVLGSAWAVLQPLVMMLVFCLLAVVLKIPTPRVNGAEIPYPVFVFAGLIPWTVFSQGMPGSALSLVNNQHLLTKVYFPRLFLPMTAAAVYLVDMVYSLGIYAVILAIYRIVPSWTVVFLPLLILMTLISTLGVGTILASLTLFYRDFRHLVPFLVQFLMYATPVFYSASTITASRPWLGWILALNPMFGVIDAYRAVILGAPLDASALLISSTSGLVLFVFGLFYFRRTERRFADFA